MSENRQWMYRRFLSNGDFNPEFLSGLDSFIKFASSKPVFMDRDKIRCPCKKCDNKWYRDTDEVEYHISKFGFTRNYDIWRFHGETSIPMVEDRNMDIDEEAFSPYHTMVMDAAGPQFNIEDTEETPNPEAQLLYDMLNAADNELWPGCKKYSQLSFLVRLMSLKADSHMSERHYDQLTELLQDAFPEDNLIHDNFYSTKKLLRGIGLPVEKIDCCPNNCMIYWRGDSELERCKFCNTSRFKDNSRESGSRKKKQVPVAKMYFFPLTPRLQRLYASKATAGEMRWHASSPDDGVMRHPADSPAWKHLNTIFPEFASECRNVRLGLSTDGFQPFGQSGKQYSSWPVILTPYNLPPGLCMKEQFMFLTVLVPGPRNPKEKLDVFLQPLIAELKHLWEVGVPTYDISLKQNFQMRAVLMWTISDFPAYSMLSGWSTAGRLACPHCMENTDAFTLEKSGKQSWFDNHRKFLPANHAFRRNKKAFRKNKTITVGPPVARSGEDIFNQIQALGLIKVAEDYDDTNKIASNRFGTGWKKMSIFWDLPYWKELLIRHNLDVMHIEKNVFDNVFNTVLNVQGKTKDTIKSREELNLYCTRPELNRNGSSGKYPKASYTFDKNEKKVLCEWVKDLKFPNGYVSNMSRCVDMSKLKMYGMKSHDCHVFMQRILPVAFRELLPQNVWKAITELCLFFKDLTSRAIKIDDMCRLNDNIPIILCNLDRIFPPSFFDSMEHLPVHLPNEARLAGPVQYRWMYPFERYLRKLKNNVRNKARVEGSICNAYLVEEVSTFCSYYFEDHVSTKMRNVPRNYIVQNNVRVNDDPDVLSIFRQTGSPLGKMSKRYLDAREYKAAQLYILLNCHEVTDIYLKELALHKDFSRVITKSFKRISNPTGINWKATPEDVKDQYFEEFRKNYSWDERWEDEVRRLWEKRASTRFPDFLYDVKVCRKPNDEGKPGYICDDQWKTLCAYWDTPEAIRKSERASKARLSEPDGPGSGISKHRGGSKSVAVRAHEMALKEGIPVKKCVYDSFRNLHVKQDGTYTYKKAEDVDARVREIAEQQGESADLSQIYVDEVMGGRLDKKQRMFGTGTLARSLVSGSSQTSHAHSQHVDARFEEMQRQLQEEREHRLRLEDSLRVTHEMLQQFLRSQQTRSSGSGGSDLPPSGDNPQL